jgi:hypothetical protein
MRVLSDPDSQEQLWIIAMKWRPYQKTRDEIEDELKRQIRNMSRSMDAFDRGALEEAERLASSVYILLHDGSGRQKSLLEQLGLKSGLQMVDSSLPPDSDPHVATLGPPLLSICVEDHRMTACARHLVNGGQEKFIKIYLDFRLAE